MTKAAVPVRSLYRWWLWALLVLFLNGCAADGGLVKTQRVASGHTLATVYFSTTGASTEQISFTIDQIALLMGDIWIDLPMNPREINRQDVQGKQILFGIGTFPTGDCRRIRFRLTKFRVGNIENSANDSDEDPQLVELTFSRPIEFAGKDSLCLFIEWDPAATVAQDRSRFAPVFSARGQSVPLGGDLAYVVCDDIDTLYMVRTDVNLVVAALGIPGPLGELAIDDQGRKLYVLSSGERSIYVYNSANTQYLDRIPLSMAVKPQYMSLSADGSAAFVTDAATNRVLRIDLASGLVSHQTTVGFRPERIIFFDDGNPHLAVSSPAAQRIFILNAETLELIKEIPAGLDADSLLFLNNRLYVGERGNNLVSVFDYRTGRQLARIAVGADPVYMLTSDNKVFVSNYREGTLSTFYGGQSTSARRVPAGPSPYALAVSERRRLLYIANREASSLTVLDLAGERIKGTVPLGGAPFSIGVLD